jgi:hypothetical protein
MAPASPRKRIKPNPEGEESTATEVQAPLPVDASLTKELSNTPSNDAINNSRDHSNREVRLGDTLEGYANTLPTRVGTTGPGLERRHR